MDTQKSVRWLIVLAIMINIAVLLVLIFFGVKKAFRTEQESIVAPAAPVAQTPPPAPQPGAQYADLREEWKKAEGKKGFYTNRPDLYLSQSFDVDARGDDILAIVGDSYVVIELWAHGKNYEQRYIPISTIILVYVRQSQ